MAGLIIETGPRRGTRYALGPKDKVTIGRDPSCDLEVSDPMASRVHCVVRRVEGGWEVADQESLNGLFVNNALAARKALSAGDVMQVGDTLISFVEEEDPLVGATLAGYKIEARVGAGSMGTVYRALQMSLERTVALKVLAPRFAADEEFIRRFLEEARAAARLQHPNVVQVFDAGQEDGHHYMSMEFLEGGSLDEAIDLEGKLSPARVVPIAIDAADALAFAERQGIVHRDVKPGNILLDAEGRAKIADLGIATDIRKLVAGAKREIAGSPRYMAPEQARGERLDHRADIYALGATMYYALAGAPAHEAPSLKALIAKKLSEDPVPLHRRVPGMPVALSAIVQKMMARDPERRFSSAAEVRQALAALLRRPAAAPARAKRRRVAAHQSRQASKQPPLLGIFLAAAVVVGAVIIYWTALRPRGELEPSEPERTAVARAPAAPPERPREAAPDAAERERLVRKAREEAARRLEAERAEAPDEPRGPPVEVSVGPDPAALEALEKGSRAIRDLLSAGKVEEAGAALDRLWEGTPEDLRPRLWDLRDAVREARRAAEKARSAAIAVASSVRRALASFDFEGASRLLDEAAGRSPGANPALEALRADVLAAKSAAEAVEKIVRGWVSSRRTLQDVIGPWSLEASLPTPKGLRAVEVAGDRLRIADASRPKEFQWRSLLSLKEEAILGAAGDLAEDARSRLREGLGILILLRQGPERAQALLQDPSLSEERRLWHGRALSEASGFWLAAGLERADARFREWAAAREDPGAELWNYLAAEAAELFLRARAVPEARDSLTRLKEIFLGARERALRAGPLDAHFHAKKVRAPRKGEIELTYDFSDPRELEDFFAVKDLGGALSWVKARKLLKLTGEVRFQRGDPFLGKIAVEGLVPPDGLDPSAPNVNVALWTREEDAVTPLLGGRPPDPREWANRTGQPGNDYAVFGMGFLIEIIGDARGGKPDPMGGFLRGIRNLLPLYLRQPANAIFTGRRGESLLQDRRELVWETAAGDLGKTGVRYSIQMDGGAVRWKVNNRALPTEEPRELDRLKKMAEQPGSVTFFTNGKEVCYAGLVISGKLNPSWLEERARKIAEEELAALEKAKS